MTTIISPKLNPPIVNVEYPQPEVGNPNGVNYLSNNQVNSLAGVKSLTLMVYPDSANTVDISFNNGSTWSLTAIKGQSLTWDNLPDSSLIKFKPTTGVASYSLHGE